ncbi:copper homeostasis protein CutC [Streptomyces cyanogenus]|uniref:Copper homeostasis protein cutC homolog n=1 Tax=Streptomyces cyanogenus TaxID=80860 RepID=A0ABX7U3E9_STRCY|nr:copper homeostasis protein CutC [Streptomyces cyanogenus]QTE03048.1 Copper homeostasis protein CutC [Streptomyces cyanogenus]
MSETILEVVVTSAEEARAAVEGGADRLELAADMEADGIAPSPAELVRTREAVTVPVRVMLRDKGGFQAAGIDELRATAGALRAAGAEEFVLGFLTPDGALDLPAVCAVLDMIPGCRWTFHRAVDHVADRKALRRAIDGLPGLDTVLSAGSVTGVAAGLHTLLEEAARQGEPGYTMAVMAGGGLQEKHVPLLHDRGVHAFHVGTAVRYQGWDSPVDPAAVRRWRDLVDAARKDAG